MKVVVIDDAPDIIEVVSLCFQLRWSGTEVVEAGEGGKGLELIEAESPDVVILDINLPDMDGFQVIRELRRFSQVPVIMLTVKGEDTDIARGLELGADDYVTKPFSHVELLARVQAVLRRAQGLTAGEGSPVRSSRPLRKARPSDTASMALSALNGSNGFRLDGEAARWSSVCVLRTRR